MFLFGPSAAQDLEGGLNLARSMIERHGGQVLVLKRWDERKLAYEVNGQKRGTYVIAYFTAPGGAIAALERDVKLNDEILRVMVTTAQHMNPDEMNAVEPQPIQPREERAPWDRPYSDDRGGRRDDRSRDDRPRDDRPRDDRPREDRGPRPPRREDTTEAAGAAARE